MYSLNGSFNVDEIDPLISLSLVDLDFVQLIRLVCPPERQQKRKLTTKDIYFTFTPRTKEISLCFKRNPHFHFLILIVAAQLTLSFGLSLIEVNFTLDTLYFR